jgi:hypothetical protein
MHLILYAPPFLFQTRGIVQLVLMNMKDSQASSRDRDLSVCAAALQDQNAVAAYRFRIPSIACDKVYPVTLSSMTLLSNDASCRSGGYKLLASASKCGMNSLLKNFS